MRIKENGGNHSAAPWETNAIKLKGHSKVQLFDAVSGKEVERVEQENLITNALSRWISPDIQYCGTGANLNFVTLVNYITPIYTKGLGGILILDEPVNEDPNICWVPKGVAEVGHAGRVYTGTNPFRGTYNVSESFDIMDGLDLIGRRHVWDFATDRAIGTWRCLALTSDIGGNGGLQVESDSGAGQDSAAFSIAFLNYLYSPSTPPSNGVWTNYAFLGEVSNNRYCMIYTTANMIYLAYIKSFDKTGLLPFEQLNTSNCRIIDEKSISVSNANNQFRWVVDETMQSATLCLITSATSITRTVLNLQTGTLSSQSTLTLVGTPPGYNAYLSTSAQMAFLNGNDLYINLHHTATNTYHWSRYVVSGTTATFTSVVCPDNGVRSYAQIIGGKMFMLAGSTSMFCRWLDGDKWGTVNIQGRFLSGKSYKNQTRFPLSLFGDTNSHSTISAIYPYLGSINNLAAPINKTAAHTAKITYELYQA